MELDRKQEVKEKSIKPIYQTFEANNFEIDQKFDEMVVNEGNLYRCTVCDKTFQSKNRKQDMRRHLETHLTGLSYDCSTCGQNFRSSNALRLHMKRRCSGGAYL